jgi:DNA-binding GntR family transcriptional regulator
VTVQIADDLRAKIESGTYAPGEKIPAIRTLAESYGVAYQTVREALTVLRNEGLIASQKTRGTFVLRVPGERRPTEHEIAMSRIDSLAERVGVLESRVSELEADRES